MFDFFKKHPLVVTGSLLCLLQVGFGISHGGLTRLMEIIFYMGVVIIGCDVVMAPSRTKSSK